MEKFCLKTPQVSHSISDPAFPGPHPWGKSLLAPRGGSERFCLQEGSKGCRSTTSYIEGAQESARWWTPPGGPHCAAWHTRGQAAREGYLKAAEVSGGDPFSFPHLLCFLLKQHAGVSTDTGPPVRQPGSPRARAPPQWIWPGPRGGLSYPLGVRRRAWLSTSRIGGRTTADPPVGGPRRRARQVVPSSLSSA